MTAAGRTVILSGLSGAGRRTALDVLEDMGFEAMDNLPLRLVPAVLATERGSRETAEVPVVIGLDSRTRDFDAGRLLATIDDLRRQDLDVTLLYLDCRDTVLQQRFSETRRRHPLAHARPIADGIREERTRLSGLRDKADLLLDTSDLTVHDLRRELEALFPDIERESMTVSLISFAYRRGLPREADVVFDARFLKNPHYEDMLQPLTGLDPSVAAYIEEDRRTALFIERIEDYLNTLLPFYRSEGKSYFTIAIGCTGGRHRSVYAVERLARALEPGGHAVHVVHREL